ncbi:MAG: hypothetical protein Q8Q29_04255 [Actinomycetota bacterium]|nr:hypothetical protein [Actinomycetota bacterium]
MFAQTHSSAAPFPWLPEAECTGQGAFRRKPGTDRRFARFAAATLAFNAGVVLGPSSGHRPR